MSTSDRHEQGPLTRKQLREIRLTGSTPVITPEEAAAAASAQTEPDAVEPTPPTEPTEVTPAPVSVGRGEAAGSARLTRRQVRELERSRSGGDAEAPADADASADADADAPVVHEDATGDESVVAQSEHPVHDAADDDDIDDDGVDHEVAATPVSASTSAEQSADVSPSSEDDVDAVSTDGRDADEPSMADDSDDEAERPTVSPGFGQGVLTDQPDPVKPFTPSFDELLTVGDSTGSQHRAGNTLIFNPAPGDGSLSGPVASTGEILVTGSYELPKGLGSQGHAHGTTDGKEVDAVLIDGELPPASSPTPIAASAAVSTIKPAGEVIRPPAPEKGNKLMLILAIVAGGLALALGVALIVAFTTNVF